MPSMRSARSGRDRARRRRAVWAECACEVLIFNLPADKAAKWSAAVRRVLEVSRMSPAEAGKLAGALSWAASAVFGRGE